MLKAIKADKNDGTRWAIVGYEKQDTCTPNLTYALLGKIVLTCFCIYVIASNSAFCSTNPSLQDKHEHLNVLTTGMGGIEEMTYALSATESNKIVHAVVK